MPPARLLLPLLVALSLLAGAKDKKKVTLPPDILRAQTALVVIRPDAGEPVNDPTANRRAREDVEKALMNWNRFDLAMEASTADVVIAVRKGTGESARPTIQNSPIDNRPVIFEPSDGTVRVGGQQGRPPDLSRPTGGPNHPSPRIGSEMGPAEDSFEVYRGKVEHPLDAPPVWRYISNNCLSSPDVPAVEQFRKALEEAEKAAGQKSQP